ncbi:MAG: MMPL family transporter [Verrucomicrobia bacterium]|jgi:predicted exporter/lauroyl/myristoyl acyltransferase|nr:MMPL family transporter [Verrucomicrobiota bacterium]
MNCRWLRWGWLLLALALVLGLLRLRWDVEVLNLLPGELPVIQGLKLYQKYFTSTRELVLTLRAPDAETATTAARQLVDVLRGETNLVANALWQPPLQEHPDQTAELIAYLWLNQLPAAFAQLTNRLAPDKFERVLAESREQLSTTLSPMEIARLGYDPFGFTRLPETGLGGEMSLGSQKDSFASADGTFRVVFVEARDELSNYRTCAAWFNRIKAAVNRWENSANRPGPVTIRFTGTPAFVAEMSTGMERDLQGSALSTTLLIVGLFWWAHRSWRPLLWLLAALGLIVAGTLASGGLIFGKLNAVSLGFAAILLGLAVDYGLMLYQEWVAAPELSARELRRIHTPGIVWSAVTTAAAFSLLNFAGLPGLSQLGSLVAIGVLLAAVVMLYLFLPGVMRGGLRKTDPRANRKSPIVKWPAAGTPEFARLATGIIALFAMLVLWHSWPPMEHSSGPLQPKHNPAKTALDEMQTELNQQGEPLLLVFSGRDVHEVALRLDAVGAQLAQAVTNHEARGFMLPTALWPHAEWQRINLAAARGLITQAEKMKAAAQQAGFTSDALALTEDLFRAWKFAGETTGAIWPTNEASQWLLKRAVARDGENWLAAGAIYPGTNDVTAATLAKLTPELPGVWLTAWPLLGEAMLQHVEQRLWWVVAAMVVMVGVCLWLAFRRWTEVGLSFAALGFSLVVLLAVMSLAGWSWNLMNLMAIPILLGAGVDYTIHIQLALRRHGGDIAAVRRITGRAVFLCAATTAAGFGSNGLSSNAGLASLGLVCSTGIALVYFTAIYLLPVWWRKLAGGTTNAPPPSKNPSSLYSARLWSAGLIVARLLPAGFCEALARMAAAVYWRLARHRREVVIQNILPALNGNREAAEAATQKLFRQFALKLSDLWRFENGEPVDDWLAEWSGWETFDVARARGRGVLIVTPHLGNWEFGGAFLAQRGGKLLVLTQPEPGAGFTELRQKSRARRGIETLVVGEDTFAFVEIIKRLQAGATVALLVDRPPPPTAVTVEMFGRPFRASIAAAELARASGCAVIPTFVVRKPGGYEAQLLPEIVYDRAAIGDRAARIKLTQEILRAFEPAIRQHVEQWYHFVPVWPK